MGQRFNTPVNRLRDWRAWLLLLALGCTVALYSVEATHNHRTAADDLRCPVCHVLGHNALDSNTPDLKPALVPALLGFALLPVVFAVLPRHSAYLTPPSRAPPTR
ncbi:MAG TPA: hypothetical protein VGN70_08335 [Gammaproteobacteria bacterium]|jgi:hypothetical protein